MFKIFKSDFVFRTTSKPCFQNIHYSIQGFAKQSEVCDIQSIWYRLYDIDYIILYKEHEIITFESGFCIFRFLELINFTFMCRIQINLLIINCCNGFGCNLFMVFPSKNKVDDPGGPNDLKRTVCEVVRSWGKSIF